MARQVLQFSIKRNVLHRRRCRFSSLTPIRSPWNVRERHWWDCMIVILIQHQPLLFSLLSPDSNELDDGKLHGNKRIAWIDLNNNCINMQIFCCSFYSFSVFLFLHLKSSNSDYNLDNGLWGQKQNKCSLFSAIHLAMLKWNFVLFEKKNNKEVKSNSLCYQSTFHLCKLSGNCEKNFSNGTVQIPFNCRSNFFFRKHLWNFISRFWNQTMFLGEKFCEVS